VVADWSDRAVDIFGWSRDEAIGRSIAELVIPERYRQAHRNGLRRYFETRHGEILGKRTEVSGLRKNGEEIPVELSISPLQDGESILFVGFLRDVAERYAMGLVGASLEELLAFERLHADLSAQFANISSERVEVQIDRALRQILGFLGFDRCSYS